MRGFRLGTVFGIPIRINTSFLILLAILLIWQGIIGALLLVVTFTSVLLHEFGHALVARRLKVPIIGIDLHFFGGAAKMGRMPSSPKEEILIAIAGPAVSFLLSAVGFAVYMATGIFFVKYFATINLILGGFNLLPALPMDGGRVFRALLSRKVGRLRATSISVKVNRVISIGLGVLGLVQGNLFLAGLAVMLWMMGSAELRAARAWSWQEDQPGVDVLDPQGNVMNNPMNSPGQQQFIIEEQRGQGTRRWIVRDHSGKIIFMTEQPLNW